MQSTNPATAFLESQANAAPEFIYLASPYQHDNKDVMNARRRAVTDYAAHMVRQGLFPFAPVTYTALLEEHLAAPPGGWYNFDLAWLKSARELRIMALPGWENSRGILLERAFALANNTPCTVVPYREIMQQLDEGTREILNRAVAPS